MTKSNLIPLNKRSKKRRTEIQLKGQRSITEKRRISCALNPMKHGRYSKFFSKKVLELAKNPQSCALQIFNLVSAIEKDWDKFNPKLKMELGRLYCEAYKTIHGTRNINITSTQDQWDTLFGKLGIK